MSKKDTPRTKKANPGRIDAVVMKKLFLAEGPQISQLSAGPEPSLHGCLCRYYTVNGIPLAIAEKYADKYMRRWIEKYS